MGNGYWGGEQYAVDRSKDLWNANTGRTVYQNVDNYLSRQIDEKIDPYYKNLQNFGAEAKNEAYNLGDKWSGAGDQAATGSRQVYDNSLAHANAQAARWQGQGDKISQEGATQREGWSGNLEKLGGIGTKQNQSWADYLGGVDSSRQDLNQGWKDQISGGQEDLGGLANRIQAGGKEQSGRWQGNLDELGATGAGEDAMWNKFIGSVDQAGSDVAGLYSKPRGVYEGQVDDPSKRGFDAGTLQGMYSRGAEQALAGQNNSARQIAKLTASSGVGGTGSQFKNLQQAQEAASQAQLGNARDVGIAQGTAQREDLANALQGLTQIGSLTDTGQARYKGIGLDARKGMTADQQAIAGLKQRGIAGMGADTQGFMGLEGTTLGTKADIGLKGQAGISDSTARMTGLEQAGRESQAAGERSMMGLEQGALTGGNRDVTNLLNLGVDSEKARASDLATTQAAQAAAKQNEAENMFKGLEGQGQAFDIGNRAQENAFQQQGAAQDRLNDYMKTFQAGEAGQTEISKLLLDSLGVPLAADQATRNNPGMLTKMGNEFTGNFGAAAGKALGNKAGGAIGK